MYSLLKIFLLFSGLFFSPVLEANSEQSHVKVSPFKIEFFESGKKTPTYTKNLPKEFIGITTGAQVISWNRFQNAFVWLEINKGSGPNSLLLWIPYLDQLREFDLTRFSGNHSSLTRVTFRAGFDGNIAFYVRSKSVEQPARLVREITPEGKIITVNLRIPEDVIGPEGLVFHSTGNDGTYFFYL
tara:strand:- start:1179 stop:1733 length:555 start_codon:yes stop_codon:yes gene_type:complete